MDDDEQFVVSDAGEIIGTATTREAADELRRLHAAGEAPPFEYTAEHEARRVGEGVGAFAREISMSINGGPEIPLEDLHELAGHARGVLRGGEQSELGGMPPAVPAPMFHGNEYRSVKLALSGGSTFHVFDLDASDYALALRTEAPFEITVRGRIGGFAWRTRWKDGVPIRTLTVRLEVDEIDGAPESVA